MAEDMRTLCHGEVMNRRRACRMHDVEGRIVQPAIPRPPRSLWRGPARSVLSTSFPMTVDYAIGLALSVLLLGYLVYALLKPERF